MAKHSIKAVANITGISPHLIRAWERRYNAVIPQRTPTNRRLYSEEDIRRLALLHKATKSGESIGQIANLPLTELIELVGAAPDKPGTNGDDGRLADKTIPSDYVDQCLQAASQINQKKLEAILMKAAVNLSQPVFLGQVMEPLMYKTGDLWRSGEFKVVHEHVVSAVVRTILGGMLNTQNVPDQAPVMIATTPAGQIHELGALLAAVTAAADGWRVVYLGPNIPVDDIANAVSQQGASVIILSMVYPSDDSTVAQEFTKLRRYIGKEVKVLVGGRAAKYYQNVFDSMGAIYLETLDGLRIELEKTRNSFSV